MPIPPQVLIAGMQFIGNLLPGIFGGGHAPVQEEVAKTAMYVWNGALPFEFGNIKAFCLTNFGHYYDNHFTQTVQIVEAWRLKYHNGVAKPGQEGYSVDINTVYPSNSPEYIEWQKSQNPLSNSGLGDILTSATKESGFGGIILVIVIGYVLSLIFKKNRR